MPTGLCPSTNLAAPGHDAGPESVRRSAFYLQSQGQSLSAWLHHRDRVLSHGILLCPSWGHEQVHAHRAWRFLADALAAVGFPVLRIDYHGTGDSAGTDEDPDRLATWLANLRDASAWLKHQVGGAKISAVGLRLGAALATQLAEAEEIDSLLLWAPVVSGRHFVREMKALGLTAVWKAPPLPDAPHDIESGGFVLTKQTADALSRFDVLKIRPRCRRALLMERDDLPGDRRLFDHLSALGIPSEQAALSGYADMIAEPHQTRLPFQAIAHAVHWLRPAANDAVWQDRKLDAALPHRAGIVHCQTSSQDSALIMPDRNLFGVLTEPTVATSDRPLVLWLNSGASYRPGPSRLNLLVARQLAAHGFRTLRFDLSGIGDSAAPGAEGTIDCYAESAFRDIESALAFARAELGARRVVMAGLCSGAYFAFQAAAQVAEPLLVESIIINPLTFFWKDGMTLETGVTAEDLEFHYYQHAACQPNKWFRLLTGQSRVGIRGAIAKLWQRWRHSPNRAGASVTLNDGPVTHPPADDLPGDLKRIAMRGRKLTCFFARSDPGYGILMRRARDEVSQLQAAGVVSVAIMDDADHTFSFRVPRLAVMRAITEHLCRRYPESSSPA